MRSSRNSIGLAETRDRIKKLQFKLCPVQVFTYMDTGVFKPEQFLGFLRAVLSSPYGDGKNNFGVLADLVGVTCEARFDGAGAIQSMLLKFMKDGQVRAVH